MNLAMDPDGVIAGGCQPTTLLRVGSLLKEGLGSAVPCVWLSHITNQVLGEFVQLP